MGLLHRRRRVLFLHFSTVAGAILVTSEIGVALGLFLLAAVFAGNVAADLLGVDE